MTWINKINSFAEAEQRYNDTKPMRGKRKADNVRPLGDRRRHWERIAKVNDSIYVLVCGGHADTVYNWGSGQTTFREQYPLTAEEVVRLSPIVWRKHKDGTETVTVRNGAGEWNHNSRYSFIERALPRELWFKQTRNGKQFIYNRSKGQDVHLPKTTSAPRHVTEYHKDQASQPGASDYAKRWMNVFTEGDDGLSVTFKREENGNFTLVGEAPKVMVDRTRMNKDLKSNFKADIAALFTNATAIYPLLADQMKNSWTFGREKGKELEAIAKEHGLEELYGKYSSTPFHMARPELVRDILKDPDHPMRHGLNIAAMIEIADVVRKYENHRRHLEFKDLPTEHLDDECSKSIRTRFNRWISQLGGFTVTTREEK
jgi:hypothetical protein